MIDFDSKWQIAQIKSRECARSEIDRYIVINNNGEAPNQNRLNLKTETTNSSLGKNSNYLTVCRYLSEVVEKNNLRFRLFTYQAIIDYNHL